jgi:thymidylate kinase
VASLLLAFSIRGYTKQRYVNLISKYIRDSKNSDALYKSLDSRISKRRLKKLFDAIEKGENKLSRKNVIINRTNFIFSSLVKSGAILGFVLYLVSRIRELTKAKGMLIVFVGPDGSGKSTVIEKLSNEIVPELATSVKYYHDKFELLPSLSRLRGQKVLNDRSTQTGALRKYSVKRKLLYIAYYSVDYFLGRIVVGYNKMKGGYIIFDRYYYDYYFQRNYHWKSYAIPNTFKFLIPRPDLTVFLSDSPENIFERKQDISVDEIRRQQAIIRAKSDLFNGFYEVENKFGFLDRTVSTIVNRINTK